MIYVTESFAPPLSEVNAYLEQIWSSKQFTNRGKLVQLLEERIRSRYKTNNVLIVNNGTIAIQIALRALKSEKSEVITTPFSYVATTSSIVWEGKTPIFADIDPETLCIDPEQVKSKITRNTAAIVATHVFGNMCDVESLEELGKAHNIPIIYDAAHCFGVNYNGKSAFNYGDISTTSFHATKLFHTGEGGAIFCDDEDLINRIYYMHNFGHKGKEEFQGLGINGKISDINAALGLANLEYIPQIVSDRKVRVEAYESGLKQANVSLPTFNKKIDRNYAYMPVIFENEDKLLKTVSALQKEEIYPRRYFYPSLDTLPYVDPADVPKAKDVSTSVLCIPLWDTIPLNKISEISTIIALNAQ